MLSWWFAWLVGLLCACGVRRIKGLQRVCLSFSFFASAFHLLCPFLCPLCSGYLLLVLLHCLCGSLGVVVVSFSLSVYAQKERAQRFCPLCPLLFYCGCLDSYIVIKEFRCRCFGFFEFIRFVLPCNAARIGRLARSYFDFLRHNVNIANYCSAFLK